MTVRPGRTRSSSDFSLRCRDDIAPAEALQRELPTFSLCSSQRLYLDIKKLAPK